MLSTHVLLETEHKKTIRLDGMRLRAALLRYARYSEIEEIDDALVPVRDGQIEPIVSYEPPGDDLFAGTATRYVAEPHQVRHFIHDGSCASRVRRRRSIRALSAA